MVNVFISHFLSILSLAPERVLRILKMHHIQLMHLKEASSGEKQDDDYRVASWLGAEPATEVSS
jgi:hypothetical protein